MAVTGRLLDFALLAVTCGASLAQARGDGAR